MSCDPKYLFLGITLLLNACSLAYKGTGKIMLGYAEDQGIPYILASDDVTLGCDMATAFTPFLLSFSQVSESPEHLAVLLYMMAGNCSEIQAWEQELRYIRAVHAKNSFEAQDARIAQQRFVHQAALRQLTGYQYLIVAIAEPGEQCPKFASYNDEFYWLIGLLDGLQAVINDIASGGYANVPLDIAAKVARGAGCLDNQKWWGVPGAMQAAVWATLPENESDDKKTQQMLDQAIQIGLDKGVGIPYVMAAQVFWGLGDFEQVKKIIRQFVQAKNSFSRNKSYKLLNKIAFLQIQMISDRLWTEATGKRTPMAKLGTFWDDTHKPVEMIDIDDLL
jgi:hypothetical protein